MKKKINLGSKNDYWRKKICILDLFKRSTIYFSIRIILNGIIR